MVLVSSQGGESEMVKVNAIAVKKTPPAGIERYFTGLLPFLSKHADVRVTTLKTKKTTTFSRPISAYLSLWLQRSNVYRNEGEVVHVFGILPFHQNCIDILNVYDLTPWKYLGMYQQTLPRSIGYSIILQAMQSAPKIITVSEHVKRDIMQMCGRTPEDVYVIPGGVDFERFYPRGYERARNTVLFVGEDNPRKNLGKLIEGLSLCNPVPRLVWAGRECWPDERKSVTALATRLRVPLLQLGYIPDNELVSWYNRANLLVHPALDEGGSFTALEAMACGLPASVSFFTHASEIDIEECGDASEFNLFQFNVKWKSLPVGVAIVNDGGFGTVLREALGDWDDITDGDFFGEVAPGNEDVLMTFAPIDGPGGILGVTTVWYFRPPLKEIVRAEVVFDADDSWADLALSCSVGGSPFDIGAVASHEIGHVVGIAHSNNPVLTMNTFYVGSKGQTLATGDIAGFAELYGEHGGAPPDDDGKGKPPKCHPVRGC